MIVSALLIFVLPVHAQETDGQKAYSDYLIKLDVYRTNYALFEKARDFYLKTKTLVQKENARLATYDLLVARDDLMASYLTALRLGLLETKQHPGNERGDILSELEGEAPWYLNHKSTYDKTNDSIETLFAKSEEFTKEYESRTSGFIYSTLTTMALSRYLDTKNALEGIYDVAKGELSGVPESQKSLYDRWTRDIDNEFQKVTDVEIALKAIRLQFKDLKNRSPEDIYKSAILKLGEGKASLLSICGFLREILTALNNGN